MKCESRNRIYRVRIQEPDLWSANPGTGSMESESRNRIYGVRIQEPDLWSANPGNKMCIAVIST